MRRHRAIGIVVASCIVVYVVVYSNIVLFIHAPLTLPAAPPAVCLLTAPTFDESDNGASSCICVCSVPVLVSRRLFIIIIIMCVCV